MTDFKTDARFEFIYSLLEFCTILGTNVMENQIVYSISPWHLTIVEKSTGLYEVNGNSDG